MGCIMNVKIFLLAFAYLLCATGFSQLALNTTITLSAPESESVTLGFPQLGFDLEYRTELRSPCPNRILEGDLYSPDTNKAKVEKDPEAAASLFFIIDNCSSNPNIANDVEGKKFIVTTPTVTYGLVLHATANNGIQFEYTVISTAIVNIAPDWIFPKDAKAYSLSGRKIPRNSPWRNQVKLIP